MPCGRSGPGLAASLQRHLNVMARDAAFPGCFSIRPGASLHAAHAQLRCDDGGGSGSRLPGATAVIEFMRAVSASSDPARVAEVVVSRVSSWLPGACRAVLESASSGQATILARTGMGLREEASVRTIGSWVLRHSRIWRSADLGRDRRVPHGPTVSALALPLTCRMRTVAALVVLDKRLFACAVRPSRAQRRGLHLVLESAAGALDNARRIQRAERLAGTDDLTGLCNVRALTDTLRREAMRASRTGQPLSLIVIDLDGFKRINDRHGHLRGSRTLIEVAALLRDSTRRTDFTARLGGDEFAVVLPGTGGEGAVSAGERMRARIAQRGFLQREGLDVRLTASVGAATASGPGVTPDALLERADDALYRAKAGGGNRTRCDGPVSRPGRAT